MIARAWSAAPRGRVAALVGLVGLVTLLATAACKDPAREEAAREERDRALVAHIVEEDARLDRALMAADVAERGNDDARAADLLEREAIPAADAAIAAATSAAPQSAWGRARRDELLAVLRDRRDEIPRYARALRGDDLDAKLAAVEAQLALQRRALEVATKAAAGPRPGDGG